MRIARLFSRGIVGLLGLLLAITAIAWSTNPCNVCAPAHEDNLRAYLILSAGAALVALFGVVRNRLGFALPFFIGGLAALVGA